jgi:hypothetical protein
MDAAGMTQVPLRVADPDWEQFRELHGRGAAAAIRDFIAWQLHRPGAAEPRRPPESGVPPLPPLPAGVVEQFTAWYRRQPGAELPRRPGGETTAKMIRVPASDWREFVALHGGKASEAVKMFIAWQLHRHGAQLPVRIPAAGMR